MKYVSLSQYLKREYGEKYFKLSLSCATSCPNRDGVCGDKGCIFCSAKGSGDFAQSALLPIDKQIENAKALVKNKSNNDKYIAYFQAFTSTYGDTEYLRNVFFETIRRDDIAILSIATRPDCLGDEILEMIAQLNNIKPVWIELGLQTIHKSTSDYIRRCYELSVYDEAVIRLRSIGVQIISHIILGLPYETKEMMLQSVKYAGERSDGIKLQLLHILKDTDLLTEYNKGYFDTLSMEDYTDILCDCIEVLPPNVVIHRITGDGDKKILVAPLWSADKKRVLNYINKTLRDRNITQGRKCLNL